MNIIGVCGPSAIAEAFGTSVQRVIDSWHVPYKGYANVGEVRNELSKRGWKTKLEKGNKAKKFTLPKGYNSAIARIQWEGDWGHWAEAQKHTHYVYLHRVRDGNDNIRIVCDGAGEFFSGSDFEKEYLKDGHITSYIVNENEFRN